ncbi:SCO0607 family lipoprotein [Blastococcus aurantiacus]|uniref:SCO0607 family lipoprotein n=1 Tax=Blastococcus aurantiacus TaxID=1550231 RepID=UPI001C40A237|nr:hypothetical protein [Blastococcus aurantiacus]
MPRTVVTVLALAAALGASGCSPQERVCSSGEYPVRTVESTDGGMACVPDGEEPPAGYERFPAGEVPEFVDDVYPD